MTEIEKESKVQPVTLEDVDFITVKHPRALSPQASERLAAALREHVPQIKNRQIPVLILEEGMILELHRKPRNLDSVIIPFAQEPPK